MKLKPMADNVLLKAHEAPETTVSGIVLATTNKEKPMIYEVVSVGPGTKDVTMTVKAGDGSSGKKCERERGNDYGSCSHKAGGTRKSQRFA